MSIHEAHVFFLGGGWVGVETLIMFGILSGLLLMVGNVIKKRPLNPLPLQEYSNAIQEKQYFILLFFVEKQ